MQWVCGVVVAQLKASFGRLEAVVRLQIQLLSLDMLQCVKPQKDYDSSVPFQISMFNKKALFKNKRDLWVQ